MNKLKNFYLLILVCLSGLLVTSCKHLNDGHEDIYTEDGCPVRQMNTSKAAHYPVDLFLETSGSMFGFMPGSHKTSFQTGLWDVITELKDIPGSNLQVHQIHSKDEPIHDWSYDDFRTQLNSGNFQSAKSTDIPQMIDSILSRNNHQKVSILVSDLIFSPEDGSPALLDQITADIRTRFVDKGYAVDLIQKTSEFYKRAGTIVESSPYYYWVIGPKAMVLDVSERLRQVLGSHNELSYGLDPEDVSYSILPFAVPNSTVLPIACASSSNYYILGNWDGSDTPISVKLAADLSPLSSDNSSVDYLQNNLTAESVDGKIHIDNVSLASSVNDQTDKKLLEELHATHVLTVSVKDIQNNDAFVTINLKCSVPGWVDRYNLETEDNLRTKTCGLKKMIDGLQAAYQPSANIIGHPITFLITKNSN